MVKNKVAISNIYLELTRACNLNCPHCMRGDADNFSFMSFEQIDQILDNFSICYHITMGGGEPCLAKKEMFYLIDSIEKRVKKGKLVITRIGMVTNGTILNDEIIERLNEFSKTLLDNISEHELSEEIKKSAKVVNVAISKDRYHDNNPEKAMKWYKERACQNIKLSYNRFSDKEKYDIVECKRSKENGIKALKRYGIQDLHRFALLNNSYTKINDLEIPVLDGDCLAFTSKGGLLSNGFYDFSEADSPNFCNLMGDYMQEEVYDMIKNWNNKHPLLEKHALVFDGLIRNAMTEEDKKRIYSKFVDKENEVIKLVKDNPDKNIFDIYKDVLHFY